MAAQGGTPSAGERNWYAGAVNMRIGGAQWVFSIGRVDTNGGRVTEARAWQAYNRDIPVDVGEATGDTAAFLLAWERNRNVPGNQNFTVGGNVPGSSGSAPLGGKTLYWQYESSGLISYGFRKPEKKKDDLNEVIRVLQNQRQNDVRRIDDISPLARELPFMRMTPCNTCHRDKALDNPSVLAGLADFGKGLAIGTVVAVVVVATAGAAAPVIAAGGGATVLSFSAGSTVATTATAASITIIISTSSSK